MDDERTFWTLVLVIAAAMAYRYLPRWRARSPFLPPAEVERRLAQDPDAVVVDVRTAGEYGGSGGHVPGAINVPLMDLGPRLGGGEIDTMKEVPVYVYCSAEARAGRAARILRERGFRDVSVIQGGLRAWKRSRLPVETEGS